MYGKRSKSPPPKFPIDTQLFIIKKSSIKCLNHSIPETTFKYLCEKKYLKSTEISYNQIS